MAAYIVLMVECCARLLELSEEGTKFRSYYDGRLIVLTPESSVQAQVRPSGPALLTPLPPRPAE